MEKRLNAGFLTNGWDRDRVEPQPSAWSASTEAFEGEPPSANCAVVANGVETVLRTGWIEPTRRWATGENPAVAGDSGQQQHGKRGTGFSRTAERLRSLSLTIRLTIRHGLRDSPASIELSMTEADRTIVRNILEVPG
jgi:hypothetical protein